MKGRTNVCNNDGVILNANIANKEIKSGSVVAGDFVQYYTENPYVDTFNSTVFIGNIGSYSILKVSSVLYLFKDGDFIDSYSENSITSACVYGSFVVFAGGPSGSEIIGVLQITNNAFEFVDSISADFGGASITAIWAYAGKVLAKKNIKGIQKVNVCDISAQGELSNINSTEYSDTYNNYDFNVFYNGTYVYFFGSNQYMYKVSINQDNSLTSLTTFINNYPTNARTIIKGYTDAVLVTGSGILYYINLDTGVITTLASASAASGSGYIMTNIENDLFVCAKYSGNTAYGTVYLYKFDKETISAELIQTTSMSGSIKADRNAYNSWINGNIAYLKDNAKYRVYFFEIVGEYMEALTDKDYVVRYAQNGRPIGVASEAGTAGDTIGVFVPTSSY